MASYLQMSVELCLAETDLASCLQMGVELCLAGADLASCLQMGAEAGLACYVQTGVEPCHLGSFSKKSNHF